MALKQRDDEILGWLRRLYPPDTPGLVWIGSKSNFRGERFDARDLPGMLREVQRRDRDPGVFVRMSTIRPEAEKRGTAEDSVAVAALWADIDVAGPGHKHDPSKWDGRELPPDEAAAEKLIEGLPEPTVWIASGGGFYPMWLPEKPWVLDRDLTAEEWGELSVDLQAAINTKAIEHGWHFGMGTGDIARILRIPGTVNRKVQGDPRACQVEWGGGPTYHYAELRSLIPRRPEQSAPVRVAMEQGTYTPKPIPQAPKGRFVAPASPFEEQPGAVGPLDDFARRNNLDELIQADGWTFAYTDAMGRRHYARPGKHPKDGPSGNVWDEGDRQVLFVFSESAGLPTYRGLSVGEYWAHTRHSGSLQEAARSLRRLGYGTPPTTPPAAPSANREAPPGTGTPSALPAVVETVTEDIWGRRPIFQAIRNIAWERMVGPWAVLGGVLAQVACRIGPHVQLPPITGGNGTLNLFIGLVGRSGQGKDAATAVATELLGVKGRFPVRKVGSGQGINAAFTHAHPKEGEIQFNDVALLILPEIDSLAAHASMSGSTTLSNLREIYSGSQLGEHYANKEKRRHVREHGYRVGLIAGIQPARAGVLLDDADGGTPQRFVWLPVNDVNPDPPTRRFKPPLVTDLWTDYEVWMPNGENPEDEPVEVKETMLVGVCDEAQNAIREARRRNLVLDVDSDEEALNTHGLYTRLKVAAILGFIERRSHVTVEDWELAGLIMTQSEQTRARVQAKLQQKFEQSSVARGKARAVAAVAEAEQTERIQEEKLARLTADLFKKLQESPEGLTHRLASQWAGRRRGMLSDAVEALTEAGTISVETVGQSTIYKAKLG